jgi:hypothetical protein
LVQWVQNEEASVFFSFHVTPTHNRRVIADRVCDMLPLSPPDIWIIERLLRNNPEALFTPYQLGHSTKFTSYLDRAFDFGCGEKRLIFHLMVLDERIQRDRDISPETKKQYHAWIQSRISPKIVEQYHKCIQDHNGTKF